MAVMEAGPLINPSYEPLGKLTRSVHCDDLLEGIDYTCNSFNLKPAVKVYSLLSPHIETTLQGVKVLWFNPSTVSEETRSFYGNIAVTADYDEQLKNDGYKFYYIDQWRFFPPSRLVTRILATKYETFSDLEEVDLDGENSPLIYCYDTDCFCSAVDCEDEGFQKTHELEIALHVTEEDCRWCFKKTVLDYLDHSHVNKKPYYGRHDCFRFNTHGQDCPFPYDEEAVVEFLEYNA